MNHYPTLLYISLFSPVLPIVAGVYRLGVLNRKMKVVVLFLIIALTIDIIPMFLISDTKINLRLMHFYVFIEFLFVMYIVSFWQESQKMEKLFQVLLLLYVLFWFCAKFTFEPFNGLYSITTSVSQILLALGAGYTLFIVIGNRVQPLFSYQNFWVLLSFVIYYTGTLMLIALQGVLMNFSREEIFLAASINWSLKIIFNILITVGFLCPQTQP
jgi:hypothetical protein